jgi:hypothetical protein
VYKRYFQKHLTIRITSMSNIAQVLKSEIVRLSRKEVKSAVHPLRSSTFLLRKIVADLKKRTNDCRQLLKKNKPEYLRT